MSSLRVIFMGTPEFAVPSLRILLESRKNIVGVVTAEDKPQGRGQKLSFSPVKEFALQQSLRILQPPKLKDPQFIEELRSLKADLQVVVAFRMLPEVIWSMPPKGTFNLHASLLPQYRGAAPINWAIINGEKETGVTTFFLQHEIDTGEIIYQEKEPISDSDDAGTVYERLMKRGADLVLKTVDAIEAGYVKTFPQPIPGELRHAPKIFKETCEINWNNSTNTIRNFIRGLSPYPGAWTTIGDKIMKIFRVSELKTNKPLKFGEWSTDQKTFIHVTCKDGFLSVDEFQLEGKRRMNVHEFFRGNKFNIA